MLREFDGLSYEEIARLLGGTASAARKAASDGVKSLRRIYLAPGGDGKEQSR